MKLWRKDKRKRLITSNAGDRVSEFVRNKTLYTLFFITDPSGFCLTFFPKIPFFNPV